MGTVRERIAYVRGLIEGAELTGNGAITRDVLEKMLDIFDALADEVDELEIGRQEVEEYLEAIDADLGDLEDEVLGTEFDDADAEESDANFVEMQCPSCSAAVYFEEDFLFDDDDEEVACPECGEVIYRTGLTDRDTGDDVLPPS